MSEIKTSELQIQAEVAVSKSTGQVIKHKQENLVI